MLYPLSYVRESAKDTLSDCVALPDTFRGTAMHELLLEPILELGQEFPDRVFVLHHPSTSRYGCFCHEGIHGLACFSDEGGTRDFGDRIGLPGMTIVELSFDEAREVAKARPLPVVAVMLLDELERPLIHFVR